MAPPLILASQSVFRAALLRQLGLPFTQQPAHIDETPLKNEPPLKYVARIARLKALAVAAQHPGSIVLAADTPVIVGRRILQTPTTVAEAATMLRLQSGRRVHIPTAVVVVDANGKVRQQLVDSWIKFKSVTATEIEHYLASNQWQRQSGGIRIEAMECWAQKVSGTQSGIIGLPLYHTARLLTAAGLTPQPFQAA
jgi:septum formation protein